jgi:hypothetical protein
MDIMRNEQQRYTQGIEDVVKNKGSILTNPSPQFSREDKVHLMMFVGDEKRISR